MATLGQARTGNITPQDAVGLTSAGATDAVVDSEILRQLNHFKDFKTAQEDLLSAQADQISAQVNHVLQLKTTKAFLRHENNILRGPHVNVERRAPDDGKTKHGHETQDKDRDGESPRSTDDGFSRFIVQLTASVIGVCIGQYIWVYADCGTWPRSP